MYTSLMRVANPASRVVSCPIYIFVHCHDGTVFLFCVAEGAGATSSRPRKSGWRLVSRSTTWRQPVRKPMSEVMTCKMLVCRIQNERDLENYQDHFHFPLFPRFPVFPLFRFPFSRFPVSCFSRFRVLLFCHVFSPFLFSCFPVILLYFSYFEVCHFLLFLFSCFPVFLFSCFPVFLFSCFLFSCVYRFSSDFLRYDLIQHFLRHLLVEIL